MLMVEIRGLFDADHARIRAFSLHDMRQPEGVDAAANDREGLGDDRDDVIACSMNVNDG